MFRLGASTATSGDVSRQLTDRVVSAGYAAMAYWFYRWDWGEGIALDGLTAVGSALGKNAFSDFAAEEAVGWLDAGESGELDPMGPTNVVMDMVEQGTFPDIDRALAGLGPLVDRLLETGKTVTGISPHGLDGVVFVDALYGFPALGVRLGLKTGSDSIVDRVCELALQHCGHLQNRQTGLFSHFAPVDEPAAVTATWGRGNGWAVLGLSDLLVALPNDHELYAELQNRFETAADGLRSLQTREGFFRNIVDQEASYPESSATAMIEAGISQAIASGFLDSSYGAMADAAWSAIEHRIDTNGHLVGVSYRPGVNEDVRRYEHTPAFGSYPWGQGAYLRAACGRLPSTSAGTSNSKH